ncbi:uncharacterized protein PHACADRAFT_250171 [Phanerochaete carnosa HHB-10118-sp]|uniref:Uncharacterized protein n=1 Tax=Phanerochaete carnosa (strain HHB-10118-sp) TaxID=650164 RepID=K5WJI8_PHACS|nr:uncharacterized protein PHACADRAFT_250171 [Phanerochaete carnosa HHB-10118-sp]EKM59575.1 hypothetical protein PHACADRAFT_250171 [Phanerochaete carnosa HHB-10118-sp]
MDFTASATHTLEDSTADRKKLESFRLGGPTPSTSSHHNRRLSHSRSHSRNASISPQSILLSLATPPLPSLNSPPPSPPSLPSTEKPKRNSHHRRRSSVSTRRESAEIMGVSMLNASSSSAEENINLGDKDSIRRRALLALEGKTDVGAFSKVEIPELGTPVLERGFDFPSKPSYPPGIGAGYGGGLGSLASTKRDSFGKFRASVSSKEQLGTLMEEDEEAEDSKALAFIDDVQMTLSPVPETAPEPTFLPARPRPTALNLRPLSLALIHTPLGELPTPEPSPAVRPRPGLRTLTLSPSLSNDSMPPSVDCENPAAKKRQSMIMSSSTPSSFVPSRRQSLGATAESARSRVSRRSSISYVSSTDSVSYSIPGLPTPELTPTSDQRYSLSSESSSGSQASRSSRSLSSSEHHFLYQAHSALVQRISDLERALSARPHSRSQSYASEASAPSDAPNDEMLLLVADLKAERDELKKDVEGWRTRLSDTERQVSMLMKRVEVERREAWVARERVGMVEIEKKSLEKVVAEKESWGQEGWAKYTRVQLDLAKALDECQRLRDQVARYGDIQAECCKLATALVEERKRREEAERELDSLLTTPTPQATDSKYRTPPVSRTMVYAKRGGLGFRSIGSSGSFTDVESLSDPTERPNFSLKSVEEEAEDESHELNRSESSDVENVLAGYEDEDEDDNYSFQASLSNSSFGSDECPREISHLVESSVEDIPSLISSRSASSSPAPASPPTQIHGRHHSLSKTWTFPQHVEEVANTVRPAEEIDRFFECLEDVDNSPPLHSKLRSLESSKDLFSRALATVDDDVPPFLIPSMIGVEIHESSIRAALDVVLEEDEVEEDDASVRGDGDSEIVGQIVEGGIIFTFNPPPDFEGPDDVPVRAIVSPVSPVKDEPGVPCMKGSPSAIPRPATKAFTPSTPTSTSRIPPKVSLVRPSKSTGSSSTPAKKSPPLPQTATRKVQPASFIPQPRRSPAYSAPSNALYSTPTKSQSKSRSSMVPLKTSTPKRPLRR